MEPARGALHFPTGMSKISALLMHATPSTRDSLRMASVGTSSILRCGMMTSIKTLSFRNCFRANKQLSWSIKGQLTGSMLFRLDQKFSGHHQLWPLSNRRISGEFSEDSHKALGIRIIGRSMSWMHTYFRLMTDKNTIRQALSQCFKTLTEDQILAT